MEKKIHHWVKNAPSNEELFRKVVHIVIYAISLNAGFSESMVLKGGILMGISYQSSRYTTDIDFSNRNIIRKADYDSFEKEFNSLLNESTIELLYNITCKIQSHEFKPKHENSEFPSLKVKIGYADKNNKQLVKRLLEGTGSSSTLSIDFSFNEEIGSVEELTIEGENSISVYTLESMISEKLRSVLQQPIRNRNRRQDIYDLHYLITNNIECKNDQVKYNVLELLFLKSEGKGIDNYLHKDALNDKDIILRSKKEYSTLQDEIYDRLPIFEDIYEHVNEYYRSLPWEFYEI